MMKVFDFTRSNCLIYTKSGNIIRKFGENYQQNREISELSHSQWTKSPKNLSEGVRFCLFGTQNTMPYCQKPLCFFSDFDTESTPVSFLE